MHRLWFWVLYRQGKASNMVLILKVSAPEGWTDRNLNDRKYLSEFKKMYDIAWHCNDSLTNKLHRE